MSLPPLRIDCAAPKSTFIVLEPTYENTMQSESVRSKQKRPLVDMCVKLATKTKTKQKVPAEFSGGSSNKNKTKTSSAGFFGVSI
jgi:hypothetical protein